MKRLLLLFVAILAVSAMHAQRGKVTAATAFIDNGDLKAARQRIDDALIHDNTKEWPRTYIVAAKLASEEFKKNNKKSSIIEAADHYFKAAEFDQKGDARGRGIGRAENEIKVALTFFMPELQNAGVDAFNNEEYTVAAEIFERVVNLNKLPIYKADNLPADSVFYYYTGLAASRSKDWVKAESYFKKTIDLGYAEGDAILLLHEVFVGSGDSTKISDNLKNGFELFPEDDRILTTLINYYLSTQQNVEALEYLDEALKQDPTNHSFHNARGVMFDLSNDYDEAAAAYLKAIEIKPDFFEPLLNLGVIYYNKGAEEMRIANDIIDFRKYEVERKKAEETFRKALPYMEQAHEIKPDDKMVLETLKNLYYRFEMTEKYNVIDTKLKDLE